MRPNLVYVGTYTRSGRAEGIYVYYREPETGRLSLVQTLPDIDPSFMIIDADRRRLFAVSETKEYEGQDSGSVASYLIDQENGLLTFLSRQATLGGDPCHLCVDPTGHYLLVANHESGSVAVLPIGVDGRLLPACDLRQHEGSGPGPTQEGPHAHFVTFDPTGRFVLVNDKGIDKVLIYRLDPNSGKLRPHTPPFARLHAGAAPRHLAFHPSGRYAYVNGEADMTVTAFAYNSEQGALDEIQCLSTLPPGATGERFSTAQILVEPHGRFVYVSNRGHGSIAIFAVDQSTGRLSPIGHQATQGRMPRNFAIDPTGTWLYAASQDSDTVVPFRLDRRTGGIAPTEDVTPVGAPVCILIC